jgi:hypothetical protein
MAHDIHFSRNSALYVSQEGQTCLMDPDKNRKEKELIVNEVQWMLVVYRDSRSKVENL